MKYIYYVWVRLQISIQNVSKDVWHKVILNILKKLLKRKGSIYLSKGLGILRTVVADLLRKLCSLYFSLLNLILYSTQSLSLRKKITNIHNNYWLVVVENIGIYDDMIEYIEIWWRNPLLSKIWGGRKEQESIFKLQPIPVRSAKNNRPIPWPLRSIHWPIKSRMVGCSFDSWVLSSAMLLFCLCCCLIYFNVSFT